MARLNGKTAAATALALAAAQPALAERAEIVRQAHAIALPTCPGVPDEATSAEWADKTDEVAPLLAALIAGAAGELVKGGLTAAGEALETASKEKGIVAESTTTFFATRVAARSGSSKTARLVPQPTCLVLYADGEGAIDGIATDAALKAALEADAAQGVTLPLYDGQGTVARTLTDAGVATLPSLYAEVRVIPLREGVVLRPVLVWYRQRMDRAPTGRAAAELHVTLSVPAATDSGTAFATVRLPLPKIAPGQALAWRALRSSTSPVMAARPTAGFVETRLASMNAAYALAGTRRRELVVADRALASARRKHAAKPTAETREAVEAATLAQADATSDLASANAAADAVKSVDAGATNAKVRFVVVRDENAFGLAIAKALKGQAEAAGKAVTTALTPTPDWAATDTAYATALAAVAAKQRDYDAAVAGGSGEVAKLGDELLVLKAKLNEAAAASNRPLPYPSLL